METQELKKAMVEFKPKSLEDYKRMLHKFMEMTSGKKIDDPLCGKSEDWWIDRWRKYVGAPNEQVVNSNERI